MKRNARKTTYWLAVAVTMIISFGCAMPIPEDVSVTTPNADVSADMAAFSGVWKGFFTGKNGGTRDVMLIVKSINNANDVDLIYSYNAFIDTHRGNRNDGESGFQVLKAQFINGVLECHLRSGSSLSFKMNADGTLHAVFLGSATTSETNLHREELPKK